MEYDWEQLNEMPEYRKKQLAVLLIASTLNPLPLMRLSEELKAIALEMDESLYGGSQFEDSP